MATVVNIPEDTRNRSMGRGAGVALGKFLSLKLDERRAARFDEEETALINEMKGAKTREEATAIALTAGGRILMDPARSERILGAPELLFPDKKPVSMFDEAGQKVVVEETESNPADTEEYKNMGLGFQERRPYSIQYQNEAGDTVQNTIGSFNDASEAEQTFSAFSGALPKGARLITPEESEISLKIIDQENARRGQDIRKETSEQLRQTELQRTIDAELRMRGMEPTQENNDRVRNVVVNRDETEAGIRTLFTSVKEGGMEVFKTTSDRRLVTAATKVAEELLLRSVPRATAVETAFLAGLYESSQAPKNIFTQGEKGKEGEPLDEDSLSAMLSGKPAIDFAFTSAVGVTPAVYTHLLETTDPGPIPEYDGTEDTVVEMEVGGKFIVRMVKVNGKLLPLGK